jgi:pimeloyl-ACP methyl ester carboxylesterase
MLARLLAALVLLELLVYTLLGLWLCAQRGWAPVSAALLLLGFAVALRGALVAASFAWAYRHHGPRPANLVLHPAQRWRLFRRECLAFAGLFAFLQPLERRLMRQAQPNLPRQPALLVLLIPGIYCNAAVWWSLRRRLVASGLTDVLTINLEPVLASIDELAAQLHRRIEDVGRSTGARRIVLVAHSMGGLTARACLARMSDDERIAKLITVGSPHHGSDLARFAIGPGARDLWPGNAWLARLNDAAQQTRVPIVSLFSWHDNLVAPASSAILTGAHNIAFSGIGHLSLLFDATVASRICEEILATLKHESRA